MANALKIAIGEKMESIERDEHLVWMDLEMTGLDPQKDVILEIATIITDKDLHIVARGPVFAIQHPPHIFSLMDQWNQEQHSKSGLWQRVLHDSVSQNVAEEKTLAFLKDHVQKKQSPLAGNSIWQDRRFLAKHMPDLDDYFHYRIVDVSSVKELFKRWMPHSPKFQKKNLHLALADIEESIAELAYYRSILFPNEP